jgi:dolichyl-phosphate-mannose-protein mannosyltransferase
VARDTASRAVAADDPDTAGGLRQRMVPPLPGSAWLGWAGPVLITVFGAFLRFYRLGVPHSVVFDETYYVGDAYGILRHGVEINHVKNADALLAHGGTSILGTGGELVVHPPLGKIFIAVGEWLFGLTPFGWRFAAALIGSVSILMVARIARRMTRSTLLGCVAGLLMALDGLQLVMSRTALLDIFLEFWVLAAFGLLVLDRDRSRAALADAATALDADRQRGGQRHARDASQGGDSSPYGGESEQGGDEQHSRDAAEGPRLGIRWLRVAAGACLGAACATKWNGIYFLVAFAGLAIAWDLGARRAAGFARRLPGVLRGDAAWLPVSFGLVPLAVYLASWSGWFASSQGYDRHWAAQHGNHVPIWSALDSLYQYNRYMLQFGLGLTTKQTYASQPWTWLVMSKPVAFFYQTPPTCGSSSCSQEVLAIGTPVLWWASIPALLFCVYWWLSRRDWRAGAVLLAVAAGWLPWFWFALHDHRTMFFFYAVAFEPYLIIAVTLCLGLIIGPAKAAPGRRALGAVLAGVFLIAVLTDFAYLYPVLAAKSIPYAAWRSRMWFFSWIR